MTEPLKWCVDWNNLTRREKFLVGAPFVATEDRTYRDIVRQLERRSTSEMQVWSDFPVDVRDLAYEIAQALKSDGVWPSDVFLPDDPADIPFATHFDFTDKWDLLPYALDIVEKRFGVEMPVDFWENLGTMTFAEAIMQISRRKAEHLPGGDA